MARHTRPTTGVNNVPKYGMRKKKGFEDKWLLTDKTCKTHF